MLGALNRKDHRKIMNGNQAGAFQEEMFYAVRDPGADSAVVDLYFTDDFVHVVDETVFQRAEFDRHIATLKLEFKDMSFDFNKVIDEGDRLADVHLFHATSKDGERVTMKFIGVYTLRDGKIARFEELSRLMEGAEGERNLGSHVH